MYIDSLIKDVATDICSITKESKKRIELIESIALRVAGIVGGVFTTLGVLMGVSLLAVNPISAIALITLGACGFALSHELIEIGKNINPNKGWIDSASHLIGTGYEKTDAILDEREAVPSAFNNTWILKPAYSFVSNLLKSDQ